MRSTPGFDTRPTSDKIKETLFNILQPDIPGSSFLDLFSGSGGIGIEALSRGSTRCVFVENSPAAVRVIRANLEHTKLGGDAVVMQGSVLSAIHKLSIQKSTFDIVYMDPPYKAGYEQPVLEALAKSGILTPDTQVILEADIRNRLEFIESSAFYISRMKKYRTNQHLFLKLKHHEHAGNTSEKSDLSGDI